MLRRAGLLQSRLQVRVTRAKFGKALTHYSFSQIKNSHIRSGFTIRQQKLSWVKQQSEFTISLATPNNMVNCRDIKCKSQTSGYQAMKAGADIKRKVTEEVAVRVGVFWNGGGFKKAFHALPCTRSKRVLAKLLVAWSTHCTTKLGNDKKGWRRLIVWPGEGVIFGEV